MATISRNYPRDSKTAIFDIFAFLDNNWFEKINLILAGSAPPKLIKIIIPSRIYHLVYDDVMREREKFAINRSIPETKIVIIHEPVTEYSIIITHN